MRVAAGLPFGSARAVGRSAMLILVQGRLQTRLWADGRGNKHITAEINADRILSLERGNTGGDVANEPARDPSEESGAAVYAEPRSR
jgi:single-stranded DNA-binding protein